MLRTEFDSIVDLISSFKPDFKKNFVYLELLWKEFQEAEKNDFYTATEAAISAKLSKELPTPSQIKKHLKKNLSTSAKKFARSASDAKKFAGYENLMQRQGATKVFGVSSSGRIYFSFERSPILGDLEWEDGDEDKRRQVLLAAKSQQV